ncbi:hypothetical protein [Catenulispora subtropica]
MHWLRASDGGAAFRLLRGFFDGALLLSLGILVAAAVNWCPP